MRVQIVSFRCVLKDKLGKLISTSFNQDVTPDAESDQANSLPILMENLKKLKVGERKKFSLTADQAYGFYQTELVKKVHRSHFKDGKKLRLNDQVQTLLQSDDSPRNYRVVQTSESHVTLDANHPLAGQDLFFDIEVTSRREEEEEPEFELIPETKIFH